MNLKILSPTVFLAVIDISLVGPYYRYLIGNSLAYFYIAVIYDQIPSHYTKIWQTGEKTGWTYIEVSEQIANQLNAGCKKSYRVKGRLDEYSFEQVALIPMGDGRFIIPFNAAMRKGTGKRKGATLQVQLSLDKKEYQINSELMDCLADEPAAMGFFKSKPASYQRYYSKWIESAKTDITRTKRIALAVSSLAKKMEFGEMLRMQRDLKSIK